MAKTKKKFSKAQAAKVARHRLEREARESKRTAEILAAGAGYLRPRPLARYLGVHVITLYRWVKDGRFPTPLLMGGRARGWTAQAIRKWEADRKAA